MGNIKERIRGSLLYRYPFVEIYSVLMNLILHVKYSFNPNGPLNNKESYIFYLTKSYHIIEKGLSLPKPRLFFGKEKIRKLIHYSIMYTNKFGTDYHIGNINSALKSYVNFHLECEGYDKEPIIIEINDFLNLSSDDLCVGLGGVDIVQGKDEIITFDEYKRFISTRRSVREFTQDKINKECIDRVIELSIKTPSVCNRQGWAVYSYHERDKIDELLKFQNGNAGFGKQSQCLLIVVGKSRAFTRFEYTQLYTDAGMFSMSIINALHASGLGSCPLNLCMSYGQESKLKIAAGIKSDERLVMMIAVGHKENKYSVAKSPRMKLESVLRNS
ncbi:nitroreductase family protein [Vibrio splendidus]|uniref:Nitroreductase domain-containing protein n=1 Tax=Vibrio splendidus TaxID=29497 RepID=A0A2N7CBD4_VIBSP|nr:nitroreductase family protein [Vibrio splendidus]PMF19152.1 hypothetical protein BCV19_14150 [Vibrio splendidus]